MKKLFITLRHPGPAQAIMAILPDLCTRYYVAIVASDVALTMISKYIQNPLDNLQVYGSINGDWNCVQCHNMNDNWDTLQFSSSSEPGYIDLIHRLAKLIKQYRPNIALRTTPASLWGVDEALAEACFLAGVHCQCRCYQEWYHCGQGLEQFPDEIAVTDKIAVELLNQDGIKARPVGWINALLFRNQRPYAQMRKDSRTQLGLNDEEIAILYCASTCEDIAAELSHFASFATLAFGAKLFIRFHPRTSIEEREAYLQEAAGIPITVDELPLEASIAFADYLVSVGSAINMDSLQYQIISGEENLSTVSVYTSGPSTNRIRKSATGNHEMPLATVGNGSLIIPEHDLSLLAVRLEEQHRKKLFEETSRLLGGCSNTIVQSFVDYLENEKRN